MIKKQFLKQSFEKSVKSVKSVLTPVGSMYVLTWLIAICEKSRCICLYAVTQKGLFCYQKSYPFKTFKNAYQFMVRL